MQIGLIGAGNMGSAMARGWGRPVLASDSGSGRAAALVAELGGEALSNAEVAERADLVVLAHKPAQLEAVAAGLAPSASCPCSGGTTRGAAARRLPGRAGDAGRAQHPGRAEGRACCVVPNETDDDEVSRCSEELGAVVRVPEALMGVAGAISGVGPAYVALVAEAWADAAIKAGLHAPPGHRARDGDAGRRRRAAARAGHARRAPRRDVAGRHDRPRARRARARGPAPRVRGRDGRRRRVRAP